MNKLTDFIRFIFIIMLLVFTKSIMASCHNHIHSTTPDNDFVLNNNGTVNHISTGLMWMRCSLGQRWDGNTCIETASTYTWVEALAEAQGINFNDFTDWRLPNKNELASLVELGCTFPAINSLAFPNSPSGWFWSSSPSVDSSQNKAWIVSFGEGGVGSALRNQDGLVRLVRSAN